MLAYLDAVHLLGNQILAAVAEASEITIPDHSSNEAPYLLMKLIYYWPQAAEQSLRNGVAAHCDWSWITILLQDDSGLQVQSRSGEWVDAPPIDGAVIVNLGELVEIVSGGYFRATPHRVLNRSLSRSRVSIPVFINPVMDETITPALRQRAESSVTSVESKDHVHRVANPDQPVTPFKFGQSEWARKGLGRWCYDQKCSGVCPPWCQVRT
jgi:isopenicillin N synthase-like dioxygenase